MALSETTPNLPAAAQSGIIGNEYAPCLMDG